MVKYELLYIIPAKHTDEEVGKLVEKVGGVIAAAGGAVSETHNLGKQKLAYPIKHLRHGHYVLAFFEAETPALAKLNEMLRLSTDVLRHLIIKRDRHLTKIPTLMTFEEIRSERDDEAPRQAVHASRAPRPQAPIKESDKITMEEIDKKLDAILTEEVR